MIGIKVLGIDPGDRRIGVAISDDTATIANPLMVIAHRSRQLDAQTILELAGEKEAGLIVVGLATDCEGKPSPQGRKAERFAAVIRSLSAVPVVMWDETGSTQAAKNARLQMGVSKKKRAGHLDDLAAAVMLQDFLDTRRSN